MSTVVSSAMFYALLESSRIPMSAMFQRREPLGSFRLINIRYSFSPFGERRSGFICSRKGGRVIRYVRSVERD